MTIIFPKRLSLVPIDLPIATIFALPPIQLPDNAAKPIQASSGKKLPNISRDIGPPKTIPNVPKSIVPIALDPRVERIFIFEDSSNNIRAGGNKYFEVQEYRDESVGIIPIPELSIGKKYIHIIGGAYLKTFLKTINDFR
jgi:hypothetical protein